MSGPGSEKPVRLPPILENQLTEAQRRAVVTFLEGPRREMRGPFVSMLHSPQFMDRAQKLGEYLRFNSVIPDKLREFATMITARRWQQSYEWHVHAPMALDVGLAPAIIEALRKYERPSDMSTDEAIVFEFCDELLRTGYVSDESYASTNALLKEQGVVELCGLCGYYTMLALVLNVAQHPLPEDAMSAFPLG